MADDLKHADNNALAKRAPMMLGRGGFDFDFESAQRFAKALIDGGMVPKGITSAGAVLGMMQAGKELGLPPMYALSNLTFTNGRLGIMGDAAKALIRNSGVLEPGTDFTETYSGEEFTPEWKCTVTAHRKGQPKPFEMEFSLADAQRAKLVRVENGKVLTYKRDGGWGDHSAPWSTYTKRLLKYRALGFLVRDHFSDVIGGLTTTEELRDYPGEPVSQEIAPPEPDPLLSQAPMTLGQDPVVEAEVVDAPPAVVDAATAEPPPSDPPVDENPDESMTLAADALITTIRQLNTVTGVERAWKNAKDLRSSLDPETLDRVTLTYESRLDELKGN